MHTKYQPVASFFKTTHWNIYHDALKATDFRSSGHGSVDQWLIQSSFFFQTVFHPLMLSFPPNPGTKNCCLMRKGNYCMVRTGKEIIQVFLSNNQKSREDVSPDFFLSNTTLILQDIKVYIDCRYLYRKNWILASLLETLYRNPTE